LTIATITLPLLPFSLLAISILARQRITSLRSACRRPRLCFGRKRNRTTCGSSYQLRFRCFGPCRYSG
jgi:hypothetical protein